MPIVTVVFMYILFSLTTANGQETVRNAPVAKKLPRVQLITTGGTIANKEGGRLSAQDLVQMLPDLERYAELNAEEFTNVRSGEITLSQWIDLSRRINTLFKKDKNLAGIVVTSGTDTLEELAFFLHLTVNDARPVVVVGAMRRPSVVGYDGAANLLEGIRVASASESRGKGVLVVLNDEINSARDVTKTDAKRLQTFQSRVHGILGVVDTDRVVFYRNLLQRHTTRSEFDISTIKELPRVDVILSYQHAPADLIKASVDGGATGIIIAGIGGGAISGLQLEGLNYAASKGVFVVIATRTGAGRVWIAPRSTTSPKQTDEQILLRKHTIAAEDHIPVKARVLLMLALTKTSKQEEIQRIFNEY